MAIYQRRREYVEAIKYTGNNLEEIIQFAGSITINYEQARTPNAVPIITVDSIAGYKKHLLSGYFLIKRREGLDVLTASDFNAIYEIVED